MIEQVDHESEIDGVVELRLRDLDGAVETRIAFEFGQVAKREWRVAFQPHLVLQGDAARSQDSHQDEGINHGGGSLLRGAVRPQL